MNSEKPHCLLNHLGFSNNPVKTVTNDVDFSYHPDTALL